MANNYLPFLPKTIGNLRGLMCLVVDSPFFVFFLCVCVCVFFGVIGCLECLKMSTLGTLGMSFLQLLISKYVAMQNIRYGWPLKTVASQCPTNQGMHVGMSPTSIRENS